jgi:hypothetical protein
MISHRELVLALTITSNIWRRTRAVIARIIHAACLIKSPVSVTL